MTQKNSTTLKRQFTFYMAIVLVLVAILSLYLVWEINNINNNYSNLINQEATAYALAEKSVAKYNQSAATLRSYVITGEPNNIDRYQQASNTGDDTLNLLQPLIKTEEGKKLFDNFESNINSYKEYAQQLILLVDARQSSEGQEKLNAEANLQAYINSNSGIIGNLTDSGDQFASYQEELLNSGNLENSSKSQRDLFIGLSLAIIIIILTSFIIYRVYKNLTMLSTQLQDKSKEVDSSASGVSASSQNMAAGAEETASTTNEVAASVEEVNTNTNQIAAIVEQVNANIQKIASDSSNASSFAKEGAEKIRVIVTQMEAIKQASSNSENVVRGLGEDANKINQIINIITSIADQTNLLALNAAIEAARAGEHGRGFAVVADEVSKLAEKSADATKEIQGLISLIQDKTSEAIDSIGDNLQQVQTGAQALNEANQTFSNIIDSVDDLTVEIQQVVKASANMTTSIGSVVATVDDVSSAIQNVAAATEEQTAATEEIASTAQDLAKLAGELDTLAAKL